MKQILISTALIAGLAAGILSDARPATAAECYADYKAKQDAPLRLHYGVVQIGSACSKPAAEAEISGRLSAAGWTLLNVLSIFGPDGLEQRKADAGPYFLRF
ncbi:hypothetical protein [Phaeobacter inhibens]|uniref:hypothetical protein n=1 Tax=Phaeobacter inhibens TaxID=221822 RepID=UPI000C9BFEE3|nr:hypothetical protein [Phaeobacter inhibens]AUQ72138.1 hypothetical protein PhaeoP54_03297 [Phaeobacter inhibens]UWR84234.1 hypothetical protein K4L05_16170 [Phaeobacter inhibens]UWR88288.1 hypothetical protein K4L01_16315 [Phaeobacter inhibens]